MCLLMSMSVALVLSAFLYITGPYIYTLFTKDPVVIEKGLEILHFMVPTFFTYVLIEIYSGSLRGQGNSFIPMIMTGLGICALRVIWLFTAVPMMPNLKTVLFSYPMTWTITSILFVVYYRYYSNKQKRMLVQSLD